MNIRKWGHETWPNPLAACVCFELKHVLSMHQDKGHSPPPSFQVQPVEIPATLSKPGADSKEANGL